MKKLFALALLAFALPASAQTTTNIVYKITVETVTGGITNSATSSLRFDATVAKDALSVNGLAYAYQSARNAGDTNTTFEVFLKNNAKAFAANYANAKLASDNTALLAKLTSLLTANQDLLTAPDLTSLNTIAAKAP